MKVIPKIFVLTYWFLCFVIHRIDLFCRVGGRVYCSGV